MMNRPADPMTHRPAHNRLGTPVPRARPSHPAWLAVPVLLVTIVGSWPADAFAQTVFSWQEIRAKFEAANPTLQADQIGGDEFKAMEITAFLRPNPQCDVTLDQIGQHVASPGTNIFSSSILYGNCGYLHERRDKRELRRDSARQTTPCAAPSHVDLDRTLTFIVRSAFVQVLTNKAAVILARDDLKFYDQMLAISRDRLRTGDIAQIDLDRLDLQRVQLESAVETADVGVRTAKIQLLMLLNDRTALDQFDVTGAFDFAEVMPRLDDLRRRAIDTRPDLRAALQGIDLANTNHKLAIANGSTDPT